ncbi:acetyltransferase [Colletotrichum karsti]|uniref:Acetyltransferase n=1 Tax=Colletotrichum karsti TaxID=1095194 RepID=A0A9P6IBM6_9PEZI|nr:acetyltransferase [Colletotrichum karsti]KAF9880422.1 acetyltransferase [Colletotrichum karsti]
MAFIRAYKPSDFEDTAHIVSLPTSPPSHPATHTSPKCRATLPPSLASSEAGRLLAPYIWTHQYTLLSPSTCHVLDDGTGRVVGYCIGCPSVTSLAAAYPRYVAEVLETVPELQGHRPRSLEAKASWNLPSGEVNEEALLQQAWKAEWLVLGEERRGLWETWRGTMHIDLLEGWQGKGWGRRLIERFEGSLREADESEGEGEGEGGRERVFGKGWHIGIGGENEKVVRFYEKMGFRVWPSAEKGSIWMTKDIE